MRKNILGVIFTLTAVIFAACSEQPQEEPEMLTQAAVFQTADEYYSSFDMQRQDIPKCYYLKNCPENAELSQITFREKSYVTAEYNVPMTAAAEGAKAKLSDYDNERLTSIICTHFLADSGEAMLKSEFIGNGFISYDTADKSYYYLPEYSLDGVELIGYEVVFLQDGELIYIHLPAQAPFEEMIKYVAVTS